MLLRRLPQACPARDRELDAEAIGREASKVWASSRLRDRIDAVIVNENLEAQGVPHDGEVQRAPETDFSNSNAAARRNPRFRRASPRRLAARSNLGASVQTWGQLS